MYMAVYVHGAGLNWNVDFNTVLLNSRKLANHIIETQMSNTDDELPPPPPFCTLF